MNWLDIVLVVLIMGVAVLGGIRGFGRTAFDALGLYAALWIAFTLTPLLAVRFTLHAGGAGVNQSWAFGLLFLVFGALMIGLSWYVYGMIHMDAGLFDKLLGIAAGIGVGMILAHSIVWALVTGDPRLQASAVLVAQGSVGHEMYSFANYHSVIDNVTGISAYRRELPDYGGRTPPHSP